MSVDPESSGVLILHLDGALERVAVLEAALIRTKHVLENIADPYNEQRRDLKRWANDALGIVDAALAPPLVTAD